MNTTKGWYSSRSRRPTGSHLEDTRVAIKTWLRVTVKINLKDEWNAFPIAYQSDGNSCGIYVLNAIECMLRTDHPPATEKTVWAHRLRYFIAAMRSVWSEVGRRQCAHLPLYLTHYSSAKLPARLVRGPASWLHHTAYRARGTRVCRADCCRGLWSARGSRAEKPSRPHGLSSNSCRAGLRHCPWRKYGNMCVVVSCTSHLHR